MFKTIWKQKKKAFQILRTENKTLKLFVGVKMTIENFNTLDVDILFTLINGFF